MINLESFLTALKSNVEFFDLDVFETEMMDVPYQIEQIDKHIKLLTKKQREEFAVIIEQIIKKSHILKPANELQKKILRDIMISAESEYEKVA